MKVKFKKLHPAAQLPTKSRKGDAGFDITAISFEKQDFTMIAKTGLAMEMPAGYECQIRPRSGLAAKGLVVANAPGTIDNGYRGEIKIILGSLTGQAPFHMTGRKDSVQCANTTVAAGERIAQLVFQPIIEVEVEEVESISEDTERGTGGLGSTGA